MNAGAPNPHGDLRAARAAMEADIRATLLSAAARVLSEEGPAALTVRRVAEAVNGDACLVTAKLVLAVDPVKLPSPE